MSACAQTANTSQRIIQMLHDKKKGTLGTRIFNKYNKLPYTFDKKAAF